LQSGPERISLTLTPVSERNPAASPYSVSYKTTPKSTEREAQLQGGPNRTVGRAIIFPLRRASTAFTSRKGIRLHKLVPCVFAPRQRGALLREQLARDTNAALRGRRGAFLNTLPKQRSGTFLLPAVPHTFMRNWKFGLLKMFCV
jgi:hypothetical protein